MAFESTRFNVRRLDPNEVSPEIFEQYQIASFQPDGGQKIYFPVSSIDEEVKNRIVERERPYRDGAKLDDTGRGAFRWIFTSLFSNNVSEPDLERNGEALYPNVLNWLIEEAFSVHAAGNLVIPTRGEIRARAESCSRNENG